MEVSLSRSYEKNKHSRRFKFYFEMLAEFVPCHIINIIHCCEHIFQSVNKNSAVNKTIKISEYLIQNNTGGKHIFKIVIEKLPSIFPKGKIFFSYSNPSKKSQKVSHKLSGHVRFSFILLSPIILPERFRFNYKR